MRWAEGELASLDGGRRTGPLVAPSHRFRDGFSIQSFGAREPVPGGSKKNMVLAGATGGGMVRIFFWNYTGLSGTHVGLCVKNAEDK